MEAKSAARRKGAFIMMVEQDLMLARFLAGLYSHKVCILLVFQALLLSPTDTSTAIGYAWVLSIVTSYGNPLW